MTNFKKENFEYSGGYLSYLVDGDWGKRTFIARFKYNKGDKAGFQAFLIKNFTVEEYLTRYENGESPLPILQSKGYVSRSTKNLCKKHGYPQTQAGFDAYIQDQMQARRA